MQPVAQHPVQAIGLMVISVFMLATMDVALKLLVEDYNSFQVVFFRCIMSVPLFLVWILLKDPRQILTAYPLGHMLRAAIGIAMLYGVGECFREMQLADAYVLFFSAPLLIALLSGPILGEPAGVFRIVASICGFGGVLVMLNPQGGDWLSYGAAMGLVAVVCYAFSVMLLRSLGRRDATLTIAFWFVLLVGIGAGLLALPDWTPLDPAHWPLLFVLGITGTFGQVLITAAYRRASAAVVAPFDYTHMIWALLYGQLIWGYLPGPQTWLGSGIVIASGLVITWHEHRGMRQRARAASAADQGASRK